VTNTSQSVIIPRTKERRKKKSAGKKRRLTSEEFDKKPKGFVLVLQQKSEIDKYEHNRQKLRSLLTNCVGR
jgi:hypothetical protein